MNILKKLFLISFISLATILFAPKAFAYTNSRMIDDAIFDNSGTMNANDIQNFLNQFPNSCLKNYQAPYPTDWYNYGGNVSAATVIRRAADMWGINPQVILATLEKEETLVSGTAGCASWRYNSALGYDCPDSGGCPRSPSNAGFSAQVSHGSWQLKFGKERSYGNTGWDGDDNINYYGYMTRGYRKRCGSCANVYYDGYASIDGQVIYLENGATASLYSYTPHLNQSFPGIFTSWFGSTLIASYQWQYVGQSPSGSLVVGQKTTWTLTAKNTGTATWYNSGPNPVRLGTSNPNDRSSVFCTNGWLLCHRPATLNESSVPPGSNGTFTFTIQAPANPGIYSEYFNLVAEGAQWMNDLGLFFQPAVSAGNFSGSLVSNNFPSTLPTNGTANVTITVKNNGNTYWYNNGKYMIDLGTYNPADRNSVFATNTWLGSNRPARMVESTVAPGQNATFNFAIKAPSTPGNYAESFSLVAEGLKWFNQAITSNISVTGAPPPPPSGGTYTGIMNVNQVLNANQILISPDGRYKLIMQGDGNLVLYSPNRAIWWTSTNGKPVVKFAVQGDGNLVLYDATYKPYWNTGTQGRGGTILAMQNDGNLVLYDSQFRSIWYTGTNGKI